MKLALCCPHLGYIALGPQLVIFLGDLDLDFPRFFGERDWKSKEIEGNREVKQLDGEGLILLKGFPMVHSGEIYG